MFCCNVSPSDQASLASLLGMRLGKLLVRYLGVPLISGKHKDSDCQPLIAKITARISRWTSKYLTFVGRFQLIDSVINSMIHCWMTFLSFQRKLSCMLKEYARHTYGLEDVTLLKVLTSARKLSALRKLEEVWDSRISLFGTRPL